MSDHEFENYLALLGRLLRLDAAQREAIAGELRDHLEERLAELLALGVPRRDAVRMTLEEFGDAAGLAAEFVTISRNVRRRWMMRVTTLSAAAVAAMVLLAVAFWPESNTGPAPPRAVAQAPEGAGTSGQPTETPREPTTEENNAATEAKLSKRIEADFVDMPLKHALDFVADTLDIQVYVDTAALEDEEIGRTPQVSIGLQRVRGDMLLGLALRQVDPRLTYLIRDGIVFITTDVVAESETEVRVYNCRDLLGLSREGTAVRRLPGTGGFGGGEGAAPAGDFGNSESPPGAAGGSGLPGLGGLGGGGGDGEGEVGGTGDVPGGGEGEVGGTGDVPGGGRGGAGRPGFGGGAAEGIGLGGAGDGVVSGGGTMRRIVAPASSADDLINIIESTVAPETWQVSGGSGTIGAYNGLLVVNQTLHGHKEIDKLLKMLREASDAKPGAAVGGFGGGPGADFGAGFGGGGFGGGGFGGGGFGGYIGRPRH